MIVYLAGYKTIENVWNKPTNSIYLLSSFWEHKNGKYKDWIKQDRHILDSGAFAAINDKKGRYKNYDWDNYVVNYIAFIKHTQQKLFFELDIDCVVGLKKVEYYRKKIEDAVGIAPIVCWHGNRGKDYWIKMCEEYSYVALGTTKANATGQSIRKNPKILQWFIDNAHKNNTKIHGLGFTALDWLPQLKFDSVDSTSWQMGCRGAKQVYCYTGASIMYKKGTGRYIDYVKLHNHNFNEWVKYQEYALHNL